MKRTHEKSEFKRFLDCAELETEQKQNVVLQIEHIQAAEGYKRAYLIESVNKTDYDRTTIEGLLNEKENFIIEQAEEILALEGKLAAAEEILAETQDCREGLRNSLKELREEEARIYNALMECKRVFGDLPQEVEDILEQRNAHFFKTTEGPNDYIPKLAKGGVLKSGQVIIAEAGPGNLLTKGIEGNE